MPLLHFLGFNMEVCCGISNADLNASAYKKHRNFSFQ
jgi:hypothetical protein